MADGSTQIAPGVHRLGNEFVNFYLVEDGNRLTLVDAGFPGQRASLDAFLRSRGRSVADIDAVLLTHAHSDHVGIAESVRADTGATVYVPAADAEEARSGRTHRREGNMATELFWKPSAWRFLAFAIRNGGARRQPRVAAVTPFTDGDLDVPGRPRVVPTPGHSPGHVCFHLPERGVLFTGDALCNLNVFTGERGPRTPARVLAYDSRQMLSSLDAIERIDAGVLAFGHGEPWTEGPPAAVARARARGLD